MFECEFSAQCITRVMNWLNTNWGGRSLMQLCRWLKDKYRGSRFRRMVIMAAIAAIVYMVWKNRNSAYWDQVIMTVDRTINDIQCIIKHRIVQIMI